jgi:hypothetical protein
MRTRTLLILLIAVTISVVGIGSAGSKEKFTPSRSSSSSNSKYVPKVSAELSKKPLRAIDDGAVNPHPTSIPDQVAYTLLFRMLAERNTADEKNAARSYLKMVFGCSDCDDYQQRAAEKQIKAFLVVVKQFERRVGNLDRQAQELHDLNGPNPSHDVLAQLNELESQKEVIVSQLVDSLPNHLDEDGMAKLHRHLNERVKRKVKMTGKARQSNCLSCHINQ